MRSSLRGLTIAGVACAIVGTAPVAVATAAPTGTPLPGQSCSVNQGLLPGVPNLGPTGPLGPLGPSGPSGGNNLPCGTSAFDLGPAGPLGPGGALGSGIPAQPAAAPQAGRTKPARPKHTRHHSKAKHTHKRAHGHHGAKRNGRH
jgi:hypothetical protein